MIGVSAPGRASAGGNAMIRSNVSVSLFAGALVGVGAVAGVSMRSGAEHAAAMAPSPAVVGTIDLERAFTQLRELTDRNSEFEKRNQARKDELLRMRSELETLQKKLKEIPKDQVAELRRLGAELIEKEEFLKTKDQLYGRLAQLEFGEAIRDLYKKCSASITRFAEQNSYDVVLLDDSSVDLPESGTQQVYNQIISNKHTLYIRQGVDITDQVVAMMNNEYAAGARR